jgi:hypothetical protein
MSHDGSINHDQSEPNVSAILWSGLVATLLLLVAIYAAIYIYHSGLSTEIMNKQSGSDPLSLQDLREEEAEKLAGYGWVSTENNTVYIPIEAAKEKVLARYATQ